MEKNIGCFNEWLLVPNVSWYSIGDINKDFRLEMSFYVGKKHKMAVVWNKERKFVKIRRSVAWL